MVRTVFAEMQPFKGVENYFIDSLLYQGNSKVVKKPLSDDINNDNDADPELGEELIVSYFDNPDCNNFAENNDKWVLNENVNFDYSLYFDDVHCLVDVSPLHMSLPMLTAMHVCM